MVTTDISHLHDVMESGTTAGLKPVEAFDLVIFGATGDLSLRKLIPAVFHRWCDNQIPEDSRLFAASKDALTQEEFRAKAETHVFDGDTSLERRARWDDFISGMTYVPVDLKGDGGGWETLKAGLHPATNRVRLFYLALPPTLYGPACQSFKRHGLNTANTRIVLEKPIGSDTHTARAINEKVGEVFPENNIFRIDHYLGKETVQNLLILRFANYLFESSWNANGIDHVQISVAETLGLGRRAGYYDKAGALRDMVQNHLLQLLCLVAMEPPHSLDPDAVRTEKLKVLKALRPITADTVADQVVRGQYSKGIVDGEKVPGYGDEVEYESPTETFVAIKAHVDNWRWAGVPFYLRTGKRMAERRSEIIVQFKQIPHDIIQADQGRMQPNRLVIRLQPDEGVRLMLTSKDPGPGGVRLKYVPLNLSFADEFSPGYPDAYERLLMAVVRGNLALFMRKDEVEASWRWIDRLVLSWQSANPPLYKYAAGTDGPSQAQLLTERDKREWI